MIVDWPPSGDVPDVDPSNELELSITTRKFILLRRVLTCAACLIQLQVGDVEVRFELDEANAPQRTYRLRDLDSLRARLAATGAAFTIRDSIAVGPDLEIRARLRNEGAAAPVKPRAALLVYEET